MWKIVGGELHNVSLGNSSSNKFYYLYINQYENYSGFEGT